MPPNRSPPKFIRMSPNGTESHPMSPNVTESVLMSIILLNVTIRSFTSTSLMSIIKWPPTEPLPRLDEESSESDVETSYVKLESVKANSDAIPTQLPQKGWQIKTRYERLADKVLKPTPEGTGQIYLQIWNRSKKDYDTYQGNANIRTSF